MKNNILQADYTQISACYQIKLPLELEKKISADDPVRLVSAFVEGMNLKELYGTYKRIRKNQATPRQMLKIYIYAAMNGLRSSREIERACRRDINFMFLLEGMPAPDNATVARFISLHLAACSKDIFAEVVCKLRELGEISCKTLYVDGTKIEANANKYTFVWKRGVTKSQAKLFEKVTGFVAECEGLYGLRTVYNGKVSLRTLKRLFKQLAKIKKSEEIVFVHGVGKRKPQLQKSVEQLEYFMSKLKEYNHKLYLCGNRNSYSKTDPDATFMRLKEDAMKNGQLKPAYNVQHGVDAQYITWVDISPSPADTPTLIPFLKDLEKHLSIRYKEIVADAGYESEEAYVYLEENGQDAYIKPTNYEISKTRKYKEDISLRDNMIYDSVTDSYTCRNGKRLNVCGIQENHTATGYVRQITTYRCEDCCGCPYKTKCIRGNNCKTPMSERKKGIVVSKTFEQKRKECLERLTSAHGVQLSINRNIQAEGSFSLVKEALGVRQYLYRSKENVLAESIVAAMAHNIWKLHFKIQGERTGTYLAA